MTLAATLTLLALSGAGVQNVPFTLRGQELTLRLYGTRGQPTALVASGDGGWTHLGPAVAEVLASRGWCVVGLNSKQYLSAFTHGSTTLSEADVPRDFEALLAFAAREAPARPVLVGVSEGAGLGVLAATNPAVQGLVQGVVGLGLPEQNELGWRFRDSIIYVTRKPPNEPSFFVSRVVARVSPVPLAMIHSTHDEFTPLEEAKRLFETAREPKRMWVVDAVNHRFSNKPEVLAATLVEALSWIAGADRR